MREDEEKKYKVIQELGVFSDEKMEEIKERKFGDQQREIERKKKGRKKR